MRTKYFVVPVVAVISFFAGTLIPNAKTDTKSPKYVQVDFMKVNPGKDADYLKVEQDLWKPIHQERIKQGLTKSWSLYGVQFPSGTDQKYGYVTINTFDQFSQLENPYGSFEKVFSKVHPGVKADEFMDRTEKSRNLVRSEVWVLIDKAE